MSKGKYALAESLDRQDHGLPSVSVALWSLRMQKRAPLRAPSSQPVSPAMASLVGPRHATPRRAVPSLPRLATPCHSRPGHALPATSCRARPYHSVAGLALPARTGHAATRRAKPCLACLAMILASRDEAPGWRGSWRGRQGMVWHGGSRRGQSWQAI